VIKQVSDINSGRLVFETLYRKLRRSYGQAVVARFGRQWCGILSRFIAASNCREQSRRPMPQRQRAFDAIRLDGAYQPNWVHGVGYAPVAAADMSNLGGLSIDTTNLYSSI
jgi:hypothetical protein